MRAIRKWYMRIPFVLCLFLGYTASVDEADSLVSSDFSILHFLMHAHSVDLAWGAYAPEALEWQT